MSKSTLNAKTHQTTESHLPAYKPLTSFLLLSNLAAGLPAADHSGLWVPGLAEGMAAVIPYWFCFLEGCSGDMLRQEMIPAEFQHIPREPMAKTQGCATGLSAWLEETTDSLVCARNHQLSLAQPRGLSKTYDETNPQTTAC